MMSARSLFPGKIYPAILPPRDSKLVTYIRQMFSARLQFPVEAATLRPVAVAVAAVAVAVAVAVAAPLPTNQWKRVKGWTKKRWLL